MSSAFDEMDKYQEGGLPYYTASMSPFLQGVELKQFFQIFSNSLYKIRSNTTLGTTVSGVLQTQNFFNDSRSPVNLGPSATTSGSHGVLPLAGSGSQANLDTHGILGVEIVHTIDRRNLGQSLIYDDSSPFVDPDPVEVSTGSIGPLAVIRTHPLSLVIPTSFVQICSSPSSFDGVIEPFDIRRVVDRTSIEMPYVAKSIKCSLSIVNPKRESLLIDDKRDLRNSATRPFLDSVETFGPISYPPDGRGLDLPGAFSDADQRIAPYTDATDREMFYASGTLDEAIRYQLIGGFVSASATYRAARPNSVRKDVVVMRHGFIYSQNDNYSYDSIAFGGLKK